VRTLNRLSATQVRHCPPGKLSDGGGLWLHKRADGGAQWFLRVTVGGRRREMGLGSLADVSLKEARAAAERWRKVAASGYDPIKERERLRREAAAERPTLAAVAEEAFEARKAQLKGDGKAGRWFSPVELHVLPKLGRTPIEDIDQNDIRMTLAPIWHEKGETARKAITRLNAIMKHAVAMGLDVDLQATEKARVLLGQSRQKTEHIPALPWADVPAFYATLTEDTVCHLALRLLILTAVRSSGVRFAHDDEFDGANWVIPAARMKAGVEHRVPLSEEALAVID
jgi:integrase